MPLERSGTCPFEGSHWPRKWERENITPKMFATILDEDQKKDLYEYFYEHQSAQSSKISRPAYRFPLQRFRDYFGAQANDFRRTVTLSEGYQKYSEERQRPPPPPEMSLLTTARIAAYLDAEPHEEIAMQAARKLREENEMARATAAQVVRKKDRQNEGIRFSDELPNKEGKFTAGGARRSETIDFDKDPHRSMVCDMQRPIERAADRSIKGFTLEKKAIFTKLVEKEVEKDKSKGHSVRTDARKPYTARAALGLILLLSSVLWYAS